MRSVAFKYELDILLSYKDMFIIDIRRLQCMVTAVSEMQGVMHGCQ
jgi:hypothetical protein